MDGRDRAILSDLPQRPALVVVKNAGDARRLAVQETAGTLGVEAKNPDPQSNAANPRRVRARAAGVNLRKRQKTGLIGTARSPRQLVQLSRVKASPIAYCVRTCRDAGLPL
jgi:hypothetical protein